MSAEIWKVVTASTPERLTQQLTALTAAKFTIYTIVADGSGGFVVVAFGSGPQKEAGTSPR